MLDLIKELQPLYQLEVVDKALIPTYLEELRWSPTQLEELLQSSLRNHAKAQLEELSSDMA